MALLEVHELQAGYGGLKVLQGLSLHVDKGELVSLLGGNGSGKSTTIKSILGFVRATHGTVSFDGREIQSSTTAAIIQAGIALVPEGRRVFPFMSVKENLLLGGWVRRHAKRELAQSLDEVLAIFPLLTERMSQNAGTLSGGEQQMLAMARALISKPKLVLMDEPTMGLAPRFVHTVFELIRSVNELGVAVLMVEQNAHAALRMTHRAYVLEHGVIAIEGRSADLLGHPRVRSAYLGEDIGADA
jgi:branched-chain amino acid transport system ATP-binding protein